MNEQLRFIIDPPCTAAFNMAADLYLLSSAHAIDEITVRLYQWKDPTITLGRMQKGDEVLDRDATKRDGVCSIRRPTGGRAVLHWNDLTYSVIFGRGCTVMGRSIDETYALIANALSRGLLRAGIESQTHDSSLDVVTLRRETKLPYFLAPNRNELMVDGRKLIGSAQKRTADAVLQHGSIPISDHFRRMPLYSRINEEARKTEMALFQSKCMCISEIDPLMSAEKMTGFLIEGFKELKALPWRMECWRNDEIDKIEELMQSERFARECL